jgi:hypothetical protein
MKKLEAKSQSTKLVFVTCVEVPLALSIKRTYLAWYIMLDLPGEIIMAHSLVMVEP